MKQITSLFFFILLICSYQYIFSQSKTGNIWYFGSYAGLDFNSGAPVVIDDSAMGQWEGCASISDQNGNILFYTNGVTIWNKTHSLMVNGNSLLGDYSASQSAIIVQKPKSDYLYYVFTCDNNDAIGDPDTTDGVNYSLVDMSLDSGKGAVIVKNELLLKRSTEKLCCIKHSNNNDVWIITHELDSNKFCSFLLTMDSINTSPIVSYSGYNHTWYNHYGCMKGSHNGEKIAVAIAQDRCQLLNFDNSTGIVSNPMTVLGDFGWNSPTGIYGVEFSPNDSILYISAYDSSSASLYQLDISLPTEGDIVNSEILLCHYEGVLGSTLQIGPDGKIYLAHVLNDYIGVVNNPNTYGFGCNYIDSAIYLNGNKSNFGLPNFINDQFNDNFSSSKRIITLDSDIRVFPNPTTRKITIEAEGVESIEVINLQGKQIYKGKETEIDLSTQPKGIYIIKVITDKQTISQKLIKQ